MRREESARDGAASGGWPACEPGSSREAPSSRRPPHLGRAASREELELTLRANACRLRAEPWQPGAARWWHAGASRASRWSTPERFVWVLLPVGQAPARQRTGSLRAEELALHLQAHCAAVPTPTEDTIISAPR